MIVVYFVPMLVWKQLMTIMMLYIADIAETLSISPKQTSYAVGDQITCEADGNPAPKVLWKHGDQEVASGKGSTSYTVTQDLIGDKNTLSCQARPAPNVPLLVHNITFEAVGK